MKRTTRLLIGSGNPKKYKDQKANPKLYHRVFTNSVRYSNAVEKFLKKGLIKIVTSIDSGTPETFKKIRGRPRFFNVFKNLKTYASIDPSRITVKYIFTDGNNNIDELQNFVKNCKNKCAECDFCDRILNKLAKLSIIPEK